MNEQELRQAKITAARQKLEQFKCHRDSLNNHIENHVVNGFFDETKANEYVDILNNKQIKNNDDDLIDMRKKDELIVELEKIESERIKQMQKMMQSNTSMSLLLEQRTSEKEFYKHKCSDLEHVVQNLEAQIADLKAQMNNNAVILKDIEEDKTTISRAMSQNKELKEHVINLEDTIIKKDKLYSELSTKLQAYEQDVQEKTAQLDSKTRQVGHFEIELNNSQNAKNELRTRCHDLTRDNFAKIELYEKAKIELDKTQAELVQMKKENEELIRQRAQLDLQNKLNNEPSAAVELPPSRRQYMSALREQTETKRDAFTLLENRFKKCINENAELRERNDRLEHLITLLEGESDCIGEYIAIYHAQRNYLNKKHEARENYFMQLLQQQNQIKKNFVVLKELLSRHFDQDCRRTTPTNYKGDLKSSNDMNALPTVTTAHNLESIHDHLEHPPNEDVRLREEKNDVADIVKLVNEIIEPLVDMDYPFTHHRLSLSPNSDGGSNSVYTYSSGSRRSSQDSLPGLPINLHEIPNFMQYHAKLPKDHMAACKCCQGAVKIL